MVEEFGADSDVPMWARGTVTLMGSGFINSGQFVKAFHHDGATLIRQEFATRDLTEDERRSTRLHLVEFGAECDHVQGKVSTHRYLLALLVPAPLFATGAFTHGSKKLSGSTRYHNDSVMDIGKFTLAVSLPGEWHLLVSCRCFMALAQKTAVDGRPAFRLRRALMEEVAHRYTTHARRPGVMRFHG